MSGHTEKFVPQDTKAVKFQKSLFHALLAHTIIVKLVNIYIGDYFVPEYPSTGQYLAPMSSQPIFRNKIDITGMKHFSAATQ